MKQKMYMISNGFKMMEKAMSQIYKKEDLDTISDNDLEQSHAQIRVVFIQNI